MAIREQREHVISEIEYVLDPIKYGYPIPAMVKGVLHDCLNFLKSERGDENLLRKVVEDLDAGDTAQRTATIDWLKTYIR